MHIRVYIHIIFTTRFIIILIQLSLVGYMRCRTFMSSRTSQTEENPPKKKLLKKTKSQEVVERTKEKKAR